MLTKSDLKSIDKLVSKRIREEVEAEGRNTRDELKNDLITSRMRTELNIRDLADRIKNLEIRVNNAAIDSKKGFKKMEKQFTDLFDFLDKDQLRTTKRVARIEEHLKLQPLINP